MKLKASDELILLEQIVVMTEGGPGEVKIIMAAYKQIINPKASLCETCGGSIRMAFKALHDYFEKNKVRLRAEAAAEPQIKETIPEEKEDKKTEKPDSIIPIEPKKKIKNMNILKKIISYPIKAFNVIVNVTLRLFIGLIAQLLFLGMLIWYRDIKKTLDKLVQLEGYIQARRLKKEINEDASHIVVQARNYNK